LKDLLCYTLGSSKLLCRAIRAIAQAMKQQTRKGKPLYCIVFLVKLGQCWFRAKIQKEKEKRGEITRGQMFQVYTFPKLCILPAATLILATHPGHSLRCTSG
jgi:hypothetical protein